MENEATEVILNMTRLQGHKSYSSRLLGFTNYGRILEYNEHLEIWNESVYSPKKLPEKVNGNKD